MRQYRAVCLLAVLAVALVVEERRLAVEIAFWRDRSVDARSVITEQSNRAAALNFPADGKGTLISRVSPTDVRNLVNDVARLAHQNPTLVQLMNASGFNLVAAPPPAASVTDSNTNSQHQ